MHVLACICTVPATAVVEGLSLLVAAVQTDRRQKVWCPFFFSQCPMFNENLSCFGPGSNVMEAVWEVEWVCYFYFVPLSVPSSETPLFACLLMPWHAH
jgi:hypothetical protein